MAFRRKLLEIIRHSTPLYCPLQHDHDGPATEPEVYASSAARSAIEIFGSPRK
jgi:hypothetical protein